MKTTAPLGFFYENEWLGMVYGSYICFIKYCNTLPENERLRLILEHHRRERGVR